MWTRDDVSPFPWALDNRTQREREREQKMGLAVKEGVRGMESEEEVELQRGGKSDGWSDRGGESDVWGESKRGLEKRWEEGEAKMEMEEGGREGEGMRKS